MLLLGLWMFYNFLLTWGQHEIHTLESILIDSYHPEQEVPSFVIFFLSYSTFLLKLIGDIDVDQNTGGQEVKKELGSGSDKMLTG